MDFNLMETVLRISNAANYSSNFKKYSIGIEDLKLLSDEDLVLIGIEEEEIRKKFIENVNRLNIRYAETRMELNIDEKYSSIVIFAIVRQLANHINNFMCILARKNIIVCDVELKPAVKTMKDSLNSLEDRLKKFENTIVHNKLKKSGCSLGKTIAKTLILTLSLGFIMTFSIRRYIS